MAAAVRVNEVTLVKPANGQNGSLVVSADQGNVELSFVDYDDLANQLEQAEYIPKDPTRIAMFNVQMEVNKARARGNLNNTDKFDELDLNKMKGLLIVDDGNPVVGLQNILTKGN